MKPTTLIFYGILISIILTIIGQHFGAYLSHKEPDPGFTSGIIVGHLLGALTVWNVLK